MSGLPPRSGSEPEEDNRELDSAAYEATVPTHLTGFRGTNPVTFVIGGAIAFGIILIAFFAILHRGSPPPKYTSSTTTTAEVQPAAPGVGAGLQTPFIPEATPDPRVVPTPIPLLVLPTAAPTPVVVPVEQPAPAPPAVEQAPPAPAYAAQNAPAVVPAPDRGDGGSSMKIDQPAQRRSGVGTGSASETTVTKYVPVYRDGRLVAVVPVVSRTDASAVRDDAGPSGATTPAVPAATSAAASTASGNASGSGQFVSNGESGPGLGAGNSGLVEARRYADDHEKDSAGYVREKSRRQLATASVINARLLTKIESDLPGPVIAQVTQPVYDSATHTVVVIPAGAKIFGRYDEQTVATSARLLMAFTRIVFPDGQEFDIGGLPGSSVDGTAGFSGDVDRHRGSLYTSALLLSVLAGAESAVTPQQTSVLSNPSISSQVQAAAGAELAQVGNKILNQAVDRPATIIIRPPYAFQIIVTRDLPLDEYVAQHR